jgi:hypothetical protein
LNDFVTIVKNTQKIDKKRRIFEKNVKMFLTKVIFML